MTLWVIFSPETKLIVLSDDSKDFQQAVECTIPGYDGEAVTPTLENT
jgi:hypothetical protein